jgi:CTP-dependent riboflavin kinase
MGIACTRATPAPGPAGSAMVAGIGIGRYFVSDASGKSLTNADTNTPVELPPGSYTVVLNGTTQSLTVRSRETTTVAAGRAVVSGTGKGRYFVSDASGKGLTNADTNAEVELFPGTYTVALNGTTQSLTVRAGEKAAASAGSAVVIGAGNGRYFVSDASGKGLTNADTNAEVELFPGTYTVALNGTTQSLAVRAGEKTAVSAGSAMVAGTGGRYFISDASGKSLTNADANTAVELFPGTYTAELNGTKESFTVRPEQQTLVRVK